MVTTRDEIDELLKRFDQNEDLDSLTEAVTQVETMDLGSYPGSSESAELRAEKLQLLLEIFNHIDLKLDPSFNPKARPPMATAPPPETGLPAGVAPKDIQDPVLRGRYEQEITANQAKVMRFGFQSKLRRVDRACTESFEAYVSAYFTMSSKSIIVDLIDEKTHSGERRALLHAIATAVFG